MRFAIDMSGWQTTPDFSQSPDEVSAVILKGSEGITIDDSFVPNLQGVIDQGMPWGTYVFSHATSQAEAEYEADVIINELEYIKSQSGAIPAYHVWFDVEASEMIDLDRQALTDVCMAFVNKLNAAGYVCGIYGSYYTLRDEIDTDQIPDYVPYWVAEYSSECTWKDENPSKNVMMWQYTDSYTIDGQNFDGNVLYEEG